MADIVTREVGATAINVPLSNAQVDNNFINLNANIQQNAELSQDLTGFVDRTSSTYSFNEGTRTFSLVPSPTFDIYFRGTKYTISTTKTIQIANTSGGRYIIYNYTSGQLEDVGSVPDIRGSILVAYIYWDASNQKAIIVGDERHGVARDTQWHYSEHRNRGAVWRSGGGLTYTLANPSTITIGVGAPLIIADEDIEHNITHSATPNQVYQQILETAASLPVLYLNGTSYVQTTASTTPYLYGANRAQYNPVSNGVGSLSQANSGQYINYWLVATNDSVYPIKLIVGHHAYNNLPQADDESFEDYGLPLPEFVPMYKISLAVNDAYTQNPAKIAIGEVDLLVSKQPTALTAFSASSHSNLADRSDSDQHPISAITGLQTSLDNKEPLGNAIAMAIALG